MELNEAEFAILQLSMHIRAEKAFEVGLVLLGSADLSTTCGIPTYYRLIKRKVISAVHFEKVLNIGKGKYRGRCMPPKFVVIGTGIKNVCSIQ
ncbi:hypothetical protein [Pasteurella sp. PK-2025]|uniref:hypothetical protein n=1 Tax=Pasteurella sp. PK-2025 TaxID=3413133 RepID=UPI003C775EA3